MKPASILPLQNAYRINPYKKNPGNTSLLRIELKDRYIHLNLIFNEMIFEFIPVVFL